MRVFITGASGHVGSAVVPELVSAGHEVVGLARSDQSADKVKALGVEVRRGDLDDLDGLREAASAADGVIHLAFKHEAMMSGDYEGAIRDDLVVVRAFGEALAGTGKPLVTTAGTLMVAMSGMGRLGTEDDVLDSGPRVESENTVIGFAERGVRSSVLRLPPTVHGPMDHHGFIPILIGIARAKGVSGYVGDGANQWPAAQTPDVARLYRLALESAPAGSRLNAVADEGVPFRRIAEAIGRRLGVPVAAIADEDVPEHFGFLAPMVVLGNPTSSARTRKLLDWTPERPDLLTDLELDHYFATAAV
ncbi:SDR family oxidoreductase [Amycolatopsis sp. NBC_00345]|uniref:SDR family oxidoreductase n=1 Tax=Amycolatopsis sp. NBC_00345 TaxID=2975955 RepID=UPI002E267053